MILDSISLNNFGLYAGRQKVTLTPPAKDKPVVLFGGLNGGGKTTFLDAIQLCLFGPHAKLSNRGRLSYRDYLSRCIHSHGDRKGAGVTLQFRHTINGQEDRFTLKRSWRRVNSSCSERFDVLKNGRLAPDLVDNWPSQVDVLMPLNIAHLFLFDGEQIERYASPAESASLVGTAIQNLLGLDIVDQLEKDLRLLSRRTKLEMTSDHSRSKLEEVEAEQQKLRNRIAAAKQDRASLRTHDIDRLTQDLQAVEFEFSRVGGELFEKKEALEEALGDARSALAKSSDSLREQASGALPLILVNEMLKSTAERDKEESDIVAARQVYELLRKRDAALLAYLESRHVDAETLALAQEFLDLDRSDHCKRADGSIYLGLSQEGPVTSSNCCCIATWMK